MRNVINTFLDRAVGTPASCHCSTALALAFGGDAHATAAPGVNWPVAGIAGRTGDAVSVSFSADGPAAAEASSGGVGSSAAPTAGPVTPAATVTASGLSTPLTTEQLAQQVRDLVTGLVAANGQTATTTDPLAGLRAGALTGSAISVQVSSTGALVGCSARLSCAVAVSVAVGGIAASSIAAPNSCAGLVGAATAIAIALTADATADAGQGAGRSCAATPTRHTAVSAIAGNTGSAYGISLTTGGPASSQVSSGDLGPVRVAADSETDTPEAVAFSGSTGDSAGVAIGVDGATANVRTGDSGQAVASCSVCSAHGGGVASASSGNTGSSFSLAGAGLQASVDAHSGASGDVAATTFGVPQTAGAGARVIGHSGTTGNAIAAAVDLSTWVSVSTHSGDAGGVTSIARGPKSDPAGGTDPAGGGGGSTVQPPTSSGSSVHTGTPAPAKHTAPPLIQPSQHQPNRSVFVTGPANTSSNTAVSVAPSPAASSPAAISTTSQHAVPAPPQQPTPRPTSTTVDTGLVGSDPTAEPAAALLPRSAGRLFSQSQHRLTNLGLGLVGIPSILLALFGLLAFGLAWRRRGPNRT